MIHLFLHDLKPPRVRVDPDLEFVLRVTFGKACDGLNGPASGSAAWRWACQLGLCVTLVERLQAMQMQGSLGPEVAKEFEATKQRALQSREALEVTLGQLEKAVTSLNVDLVLLDAPVLVCQNQKTHAPRASDLFALVAPEQSSDVTVALIRQGFSSRVRDTPRGSETVFVAPAGGALLLERQLRFVRMVPGGVFVDVDCLKRCGQLVPHAITDGHGVWQPSQAVRAARCVAQALIEHRFASEWCAASALHAAAELGLGTDEDVAFDAYLLLQTDVEHAEFEAWRELMRALALGEIGSLSNRARVLLDHALAAATVPAYRLQLRAQRKAQKWQHDGHVERIAEGLGKVIGRIRKNKHHVD
jgi:hypothetical protein